jgi:hypothetical protein
LQKTAYPRWNKLYWGLGEKVDAIVEETFNEKKNMTVISGIPSWVKCIFERLQQKISKSLGIFFKTSIYLFTAGVNFEPYEEQNSKILIIGRKVRWYRIIPCFRGIFYLSRFSKNVTATNAGIFYEFVKVTNSSI